MLKDMIKNKMDNFIWNKKDELVPFKFRGELKVIGERNGEIYHYDEDHNVVTIWAKHATMHLLTSESFSSNGTVLTDSGLEYIFSSRSIASDDHQENITNRDGTLISGEQYFSNNEGYYDTAESQHDHLSKPANLDINNTAGDSNQGFNFPFFPTKIALGTGVEYKDWDSVIAAGRNGADTDITSYKHEKNGAWADDTFNVMIDNEKNYYSNNFDTNTRKLVQARTVNDVFSGVMAGPIPTENDYGIPGIIKDCTFNNSSESLDKLKTVDGKKFAKAPYVGIGRPSFLYVTRNRFMTEGSEVRLKKGTTVGTENLESKITFTAVMPAQEDGAFYPYNGYTLKVAGLYSDSRMLLGNKVPIGNYSGGATDTDLTEQEYSNYMKMIGGLLWAKRKISPIYKSHDSKISLQWTLYLP